MALSKELEGHLAGGLTTLCRCWAVTRRDGMEQGFTDHDVDLTFEGVLFRADTGLSAKALQQTTGLSVDNTEALGALSHTSVSEADIQAGRYDGADVRAWLVNWADVPQRMLQFRGTFGEIQRSGGAFQVELRGLTEALNQPQGRVYQRPCSAVLGDGACGFDLSAAGYVAEVAVEIVEGARVFRFAEMAGFDLRWFERGRLTVLSGAAKGLIGMIKNDRLSDAGREVELWEALRAPIMEGDLVRIEAGCDKRAETCRLKFQNFVNFRGFPDIPGEDWMMSYPTQASGNSGGSLTR